MADGGSGGDKTEKASPQKLRKAREEAENAKDKLAEIQSGESIFRGIAEMMAEVPKGLILESPAQLQAAADKIYQQVAVAKAMPLGNLTQMTDEEREILSTWASEEKQ